MEILNLAADLDAGAGTGTDACMCVARPSTTGLYQE